MCVVAQARLQAETCSGITEKHLKKLIDEVDFFKSDIKEGDPLLFWFEPESVAAIRIFLGLAESRLTEYALAIGLLVAQFIRASLRRKVSKNPTWIPLKEISPRMQLSSDTFFTGLTEMPFMDIILDDSRRSERFVEPVILTANSNNVPLDDFSIDLVITSPPYCTRIDYVRMTSPEIAIFYPLLIDEERELRRKMLGSVLISGRPKADWTTIQSETARATMATICGHQSKASGTYYAKFFGNYFVEIQKSVREISRVLRDGGHGYMVLERSHYKQHEIKLDLIISEMIEASGLRPIKIWKFPKKHSMIMLNKSSWKQATSRSETELVLEFSK